jgi:hypothetical protein
MLFISFSMQIKYMLVCAIACGLCTNPVKAQTHTSTISIEKKESECVDFLQKLNKKPPNLVFEDCTTEIKQGSDVFTANDLPPINSNAAIQSPITLERKLDNEEEIYRRADHWVFA